ncbi:MAG TPA: hypothetical protein VHN20_18865 [Beijerinckiaceae bacterium]|nr:hypothetical protein [Beijerinckiaceae bacterium]
MTAFTAAQIEWTLDWLKETVCAMNITQDPAPEQPQAITGNVLKCGADTTLIATTGEQAATDKPYAL